MGHNKLLAQTTFSGEHACTLYVCLCAVYVCIFVCVYMLYFYTFADQCHKQMNKSRHSAAPHLFKAKLGFHLEVIVLIRTIIKIKIRMKQVNYSLCRL